MSDVWSGVSRSNHVTPADVGRILEHAGNGITHLADADIAIGRCAVFQPARAPARYDRSDNPGRHQPRRDGAAKSSKIGVWSGHPLYRHAKRLIGYLRGNLNTLE